MLDLTTNATSLTQTAALTSAQRANDAKAKIVFKMLTSDRMAGSVPAWVEATDPKDQTIAALAGTSQKEKFSDDLAQAQNYTTAYGPQQTETAANIEKAEEPFGFGDLVDIVNPLQHIPLVSNLYRAITGDKIRSSSDIIGGALYGGIAGAASGLANVIIKHETGKNVMEHAVAMMQGKDSYTGPKAVAKTLEQPVAAGEGERSLLRLADAETANETKALHDLPGTALSFVDLGNRAGTQATKSLAAKPERLAAMYHFNT